MIRWIILQNQNCDSCIAGFCSSDAVRFRLSSHIHTERSKLGILQYSGQNLEHRKVSTSWGYFNTVQRIRNTQRPVEKLVLQKNGDSTKVSYRISFNVHFSPLPFSGSNVTVRGNFEMSVPLPFLFHSHFCNPFFARLIRPDVLRVL